MKTLEEEAKQRTQVLIEYEHFLMGAKSKWVQSEIIKAQIELMRELYDHSYVKSGIEFWKKKFGELEQQLKDLNNE